MKGNHFYRAHLAHTKKTKRGWQRAEERQRWTLSVSMDDFDFMNDTVTGSTSQLNSPASIITNASTSNSNNNNAPNNSRTETIFQDAGEF